MTVSPLSNNFSNQLHLVSSLSDIDPQNNFDTKVTAPPGEILIKALNVLWFLYEENVICCSSGNEGVSTKISVASIITLVDGYESLKDFRM